MKHVKIRLAMRVEGDWWVAYAADMNTMTGAIKLGSISMNAIVISPGLKAAFMDLMKDALTDLIGSAGDLKWNEPEVAPEHERAGNG